MSAAVGVDVREGRGVAVRLGVMVGVALGVQEGGKVCRVIAPSMVAKRALGVVVGAGVAAGTQAPMMTSRATHQRRSQNALDTLSKAAFGAGQQALNVGAEAVQDQRGDGQRIVAVFRGNHAVIDEDD